MVQEVMQRHGRLYAPANDERLYHAATAVTGVAPGTSLSTTAGFALHNPAGSGVELAIQRVKMGYISGTLGAGSVFHAANQVPVLATPAGTAIVPIPARINGAVPAKAKPLTTATVVAPTVLRPFCSLGASLATTPEAPWLVAEDVDGEFLIPEGCTYILHAVTAAGTSPLVAYGVTWEEIAAGVA